jgi:hypothetical protein
MVPRIRDLESDISPLPGLQVALLAQDCLVGDEMANGLKLTFCNWFKASLCS